ncbi:hypothetical protein [Bradyrhizobium sp. dw_411]|uniref:hypothetical protein n=1 Tax=Bradyrhizobium sp. dw_411 TaxID=2720082 RepID=UPI001BCB267C|nr:hypothetical protein [Bradyrhizobium sp. dw_411]
MTSLSQSDLENLRTDASSLATSAFVGVLVGFGSMILHFSNGSSVLLQCVFEVFDGRLLQSGHGASPGTSAILFEFFNEQVASVNVDTVGQLTFNFGVERGFRIIPDGSGFESYVLRTSKGVFPVY